MNSCGTRGEHSKQASQWAYLLSMLCSSSRLAVGLLSFPSALLTADYAAEVRHILVQRFRALPQLS